MAGTAGAAAAVSHRVTRKPGATGQNETRPEVRSASNETRI